MDVWHYANTKDQPEKVYSIQKRRKPTIQNLSWGMPHPTMPPSAELPSSADWRDQPSRK